MRYASLLILTLGMVGLLGLGLGFQCKQVDRVYFFRNVSEPAWSYCDIYAGFCLQEHEPGAKVYWDDGSVQQDI